MLPRGSSVHLVLSINRLGGILSLIPELPVRPTNSYLPSSDMQVSWEAACGLKKAQRDRFPSVPPKAAMNPA